MTMPRRQHRGECKAKVVLEALRGERTLNELAAEYGVHPMQITQWKRVALDWLKKKLAIAVEEKRTLLEPRHPQLSLRRQCGWLGLARSSLYDQAVPEGADDLRLMRWLDEPYTATPLYGVRRMTAWLRGQGYGVNRVNHTRVARLMRQMGLEAISPKPRLSRPTAGHQIYPYRLRGVAVNRVNQVWSTDITDVRLATGCVYLVAVIDWFSRYVLSWAVSITLDVRFCVEALEQALRWGRPELFNTDQGAQFTSQEFLARLQQAGVQISMDGRGRALDHVFVERLWRTVTYEEV